MRRKRPLVSIMIPNRNHSRFLPACIESALNQTFDNKEIVVLDNCSEDDSAATVSRYFNRGVRLCRNPDNFGNQSYKILAMLTSGEYMVLLCADDLLKPAFIEKAVSIMEKHPDVGYVHCDRDYIDVDDNITELDPFYTCSFLAPGESTLPIYMLTDVAQASQCVMRRSVFERAGGYDTEFDHVNADKELWFRMSLESDYAYIKEKLSLIRIHEVRETNIGFRTFYHPLAIYFTIENQVKMGALAGHGNVVARLPAARRKLAYECLDIGLAALKENNRELTRKYMLFSQIMNEGIAEDPKYRELLSLYDRSAEAKGPEMAAGASSAMYSWRRRSYDPPEGFKRLKAQ